MTPAVPDPLALDPPRLLALVMACAGIPTERLEEAAAHKDESARLQWLAYQARLRSFALENARMEG